MAQDQLSDPFGEPHLIATLPQASRVTGFAGIALFVAVAVLLLAARGMIG
ncbi:hypothetical protein [Bradyrhizobium sp.]